MVVQLLKVFVKPTYLWKDNQLDLNNKEVYISIFSKLFANLTDIFSVIWFAIVMQFVHPLNALYFVLKWNVVKSTIRTFEILFGLSLAVIPYLFLIEGTYYLINRILFHRTFRQINYWEWIIIIMIIPLTFVYVYFEQ